MTMRAVLRWLLAALYLVAAGFHFGTPAAFMTITPDFVPMKRFIVHATGLAEGLGALALVQPWRPALRRAGAIGLAAYAVCVFPANIHHFALDMARPDGGLGLGYHVPRMFAQPILVWLALWTGGVTDWPFRPRQRRGPGA